MVGQLTHTVVVESCITVKSLGIIVHTCPHIRPYYADAQEHQVTYLSSVKRKENGVDWLGRYVLHVLFIAVAVF